MITGFKVTREMEDGSKATTELIQTVRPSTTTAVLTGIPIVASTAARTFGLRSVSKSRTTTHLRTTDASIA